MVHPFDKVLIFALFSQVYNMKSSLNTVIFMESSFLMKVYK